MTRLLIILFLLIGCEGHQARNLSSEAPQCGTVAKAKLSANGLARIVELSLDLILASDEFYEGIPDAMDFPLIESQVRMEECLKHYSDLDDDRARSVCQSLCTDENIAQLKTQTAVKLCPIGIPYALTGFNFKNIGKLKPAHYQFSNFRLVKETLIFEPSKVSIIDQEHLHICLPVKKLEVKSDLNIIDAANDNILFGANDLYLLAAPNSHGQKPQVCSMAKINYDFSEQQSFQLLEEEAPETHESRAEEYLSRHLENKLGNTTHFHLPPQSMTVQLNMSDSEIEAIVSKALRYFYRDRILVNPESYPGIEKLENLSLDQQENLVREYMGRLTQEKKYEQLTNINSELAMLGVELLAKDSEFKRFHSVNNVHLFILLRKVFNKLLSLVPNVMAEIEASMNRGLAPPSRQKVNLAIRDLQIKHIPQDHTLRLNVPNYSLQDFLDRSKLSQQFKEWEDLLKEIRVSVESEEDLYPRRKISKFSKLMKNYKKSLSESSVDQSTLFDMKRMLHHLHDLSFHANERLSKKIEEWKSELEESERMIEQNIAQNDMVVTAKLNLQAVTDLTQPLSASLNLPDHCHEIQEFHPHPIIDKNYDVALSLNLNALNVLLKEKQKRGDLDFCVTENEATTCEHNTFLGKKTLCSFSEAPKVEWAGDGLYQVSVPKINCKTHRGIVIPLLSDIFQSEAVSLSLKVKPRLCPETKICFDPVGEAKVGINTSSFLGALGSVIKSATFIYPLVANKILQSLLPKGLKQFEELDKDVYGVQLKKLETYPHSINVLFDFDFNDELKQKMLKFYKKTKSLVD